MQEDNESELFKKRALEYAVHVALGRALMQASRHEEAITALELAIKASPDKRSTWLKLAHTQPNNCCVGDCVGVFVFESLTYLTSSHS